MRALSGARDKRARESRHAMRGAVSILVGLRGQGREEDEVIESLCGHSCQDGENEARGRVPDASKGGNVARERSWEQQAIQMRMRCNRLWDGVIKDALAQPTLTPGCRPDGTLRHVTHHYYCREILHIASTSMAVSVRKITKRCHNRKG